MRHLLIFIFVLLPFTSVNADNILSKMKGVEPFDLQANTSADRETGTEGNTVEFIPMTDPQYDWSQFSDKLGSAIIGNDGLSLQNKSDENIASSVIEMILNPEIDAFVYGAVFKGPKLNEKNSLGLVFDYSDSRNYKGIKISKNEYSYFIVKDGIATDVKRGLVKYKSNIYSLLMFRKGEKIQFYLNGIEFAKFNKIKIDTAFFGVFMQGKGKTLIPSFIFSVIGQETDTEQSTTDM